MLREPSPHYTYNHLFHLRINLREELIKRKFNKISAPGIHCHPS